MMIPMPGGVRRRFRGHPAHIFYVELDDAPLAAVAAVQHSIDLFLAIEAL